MKARTLMTISLALAALLTAGCLIHVKEDEGRIKYEAPPRPCQKRIVNTKDVIGPFSEAVVAGNTLYASGQIALDANGKPLGNIEDETRAVLDSLQKVLHNAGFSMSDVVKVFVFLKDMDDYGAMNRIYSSFFPKNPPARATVEVSRLARDARVEISLIAVK